MEFSWFRISNTNTWACLIKGFHCGRIDAQFNDDGTAKYIACGIGPNKSCPTFEAAQARVAFAYCIDKHIDYGTEHISHQFLEG